MAYGNNNPFMNMNTNPYMNGGMRTPQQMQEDMNRQVQQYQNAYNQALASQNQINGFYGWKYQDNDNEIETCQVPTNGTPFILIDNKRRVMNIIQFQNGQRYTQTFTYSPFVNYQEPPKQENNQVSNDKPIINQDEDKNSLKQIFDMLKGMENRLDKLENNKSQEKKENNPFKELNKQ